MNFESEQFVAQGYDTVYRAIPHAPTLWKIWRDHAIGTDYPAEFPHISFTTLAELRSSAAALRVDTGDTLVDLACGMAGPSLWIATQLPIRLRGVDASPVAVELARSRAVANDLADRSEFAVGTFADSGLDGCSADAVITLDSLQYAPAKDAALRELARIVRPGKRLVFTAFELIADRVLGLPALGDDPVDDYRPLLERANFTVDSYEETPGWNERLSAVYQAIVRHSDVLEHEMGSEAFAALSLEVNLTLELQPYRRRIMAIATRR